MGAKMSITRLDIRLGIIIDTPESAEVISSIMGVPPTNTFRTETGNRWVYTKRYKKQKDIDQCIQEYFSSIPDLAEKIKSAQQYGSCVFRLSVVSVLGQFGVSFSQSDLQLLSQLDIPMDISVFSYGCCIDDTDCS